MPGLNDTEMGPANSLHASAYYSEYNERLDFDLITRVSLSWRNVSEEAALSHLMPSKSFSPQALLILTFLMPFSHALMQFLFQIFSS